MKWVSKLSRKLDEALQYFKNKKGLHSLFILFRKKYESFGRFGGTIDLSILSDHAIEELALFMGQSPHHLMGKGKLKLSDFEQRLMQTKFAEITLQELLEAYFEESLQSKKAERDKLIEARRKVLANCKLQYPQLALWFVYLEGRTSDTKWIWRLLLEPSFAEEVHTLALAYAALPSSFERYPIFSQRVTGDPHALDITSLRGKLWIHVLHVMAGRKGALPTQTEPLNELLLHYNLLRDDIQNFVTQANLIAYRGEREHPVWRSAVDEQSVLNVPIREILKVDRVTVAKQTFDKSSAKVYVVENSGIFSALLDAVPNAPLICTHGQFKLAGLQLMDLLAASGYTLYYSGDFDPEGLAMAVRFKQRYREQARIWRMSSSDYKASTPAVELGERIAKLAPLLDSELQEVAHAMNEIAMAGYQEGILSLLIKDLKNDGCPERQ